MRRKTLPEQPQLSLGEKAGKLVVKILDSAVSIVLLLIFLLIFLYGSFSLWQQNQVYASASAGQYAMYRPSPYDDIGFSELQALNPDVFAWLHVYGTNIDYPVAQGEENDTYVNMDVFGNFAMSGSLFLDSENARDFSDFSSIIYGHHMEKDAMFGNIDLFVDETYFQTHRYGNLYFDGADHGLEFFAFLEADAYDFSIYRPLIAPGQEEKYVAQLREKSLYQRQDVTVTAQDHIVLLSTCTSDSTNGRHILVAKLSDEVYENSFQTEAPETTAKQGADGRQGFFLEEMSGWVAVPPVILLVLIMIYIICWKAGKRRHDGTEENKD